MAVEPVSECEHEYVRVPTRIVTLGDPVREHLRERGDDGCWNAECRLCGRKEWVHWQRLG